MMVVAREIEYLSKLVVDVDVPSMLRVWFGRKGEEAERTRIGLEAGQRMGMGMMMGHCRPLALFPEGHSHTCSVDLDL